MRRPPRCSATVLTSPAGAAAGSSPVFSSRKQPVPYVTLIMPRLVHAWPKSAACWSPAMPAMGTAAPSSAGSLSPTTPLLSTHLGQQRPRHAEERQQLVVPAPLADVVEQRPRGVGGVGHVDAAAAQPPRHPAVDGAEGELASLGALAHAGHVVEQPVQLGAGEVGIEQQPGLAPDQRLGAGRRAAPRRTRRCAGPARRSPARPAPTWRGPTRSSSRADWRCRCRRCRRRARRPSPVPLARWRAAPARAPRRPAPPSPAAAC